jgi:hypothetical protein
MHEIVLNRQSKSDIYRLSAKQQIVPDFQCVPACHNHHNLLKSLRAKISRSQTVCQAVHQLTRPHLVSQDHQIAYFTFCLASQQAQFMPTKRPGLGGEQRDHLCSANRQ